jgi:membrane-associated protease RseP (regulator of RpoE activity)
LTIRELIKISKNEISGRMRLDLWSRVFGSPVFRQKKNKITREEIGFIQQNLFAQGIVSSLGESGNRFVLKVLRTSSAPKNKFVSNIILFLLTIISTMVTGSMLTGHDPFASWQELLAGSSYSFALLTILLCHEMGHYLTARYYKMNASLPYFIPFFIPFVFHPGTMGAFIKMRSSIPNKKALFDVGVNGPLAGFIASLVFLIIGFSQLPDATGVNNIIAQIHPLDDTEGLNIVLGNSILYDFLINFFNAKHLPMDEIYHFPFIFAGWFGLLVTAINLMPIGQLDGGHITYALFGDRARYIAKAAFILFIVLNVYIISNFQSYIWVLWIFLILIFIRFRHPPTLDNSIKLDVRRRTVGYFSYIIFIVTFCPLPFHIY